MITLKLYILIWFDTQKGFNSINFKKLLFILSNIDKMIYLTWTHL